MSKLTYTQALELSLQRKWKVGTCNQGKECWCRTIELVDPIDFFETSNPHNGDGIDDILTHVVIGGELSTIQAEHIVRIHNNSLAYNETRKTHE